MKNRSIPSFRYVNTLFKTVEYKLDSKNNLHITQLSNSSHHKRTIPLDSVKLSEVEQHTDTIFNLISRISSYFSFQKSIEKYTYINSITGEYLFSLRAYKYNKNEIQDFVGQLDMNINKTRTIESVEENPVSHAEQQCLINTTHLNALYNCGIIDDVIYKRISTRIYEKAFGNNEYESIANVIYLPLSR